MSDYEYPVLKEDPPVNPEEVHSQVRVSKPKEDDNEPGDDPTGDFWPLKYESRLIGCELSLTRKIPHGNYCYARRYLRTKHPQRGYVDLFIGFCRNVPGKGTDHLGTGRCQHHDGIHDKALSDEYDLPEGFGEGSAPHEQRAVSTFKHVDPYHFERSLPKAQQAHLREAEKSLLQRIDMKYPRELDFLDAKLARRLAVELHFVAKASNHVENVSGLTQTIFDESGNKLEQKAALLDDIRMRDKDIIGMLKDLGLLDDPESRKAEAIDDWREFLTATRDDPRDYVNI